MNIVADSTIVLVLVRMLVNASGVAISRMGASLAWIRGSSRFSLGNVSDFSATMVVKSGRGALGISHGRNDAVIWSCHGC
jgi:hypothetical protein